MKVEVKKKREIISRNETLRGKWRENTENDVREKHQSKVCVLI